MRPSQPCCSVLVRLYGASGEAQRRLHAATEGASPERSRNSPELFESIPTQQAASREV